jgi:glycerophosphoryl diester phosphodiesterase
VIALVRERDMQQQIVIQSFSPIVCAVALIEAPDMRTELLAASSDRDPLQWNRFLEWNRLLQPHGFNPNKNDVTQTFVNDLHARSRTIAVWTVDDPGEMRDLVRMGVDSLITNKPDVALRVTGDAGN